MKALPSLQAMWEKHKDDDFQMLLVNRQGGTIEDMAKFLKSKGVTAPVPMTSGGTDFSKYNGGGGLPYAWVIGPDGKVVWQGRKGYHAVILKQLERIKYKGLGKLEVHEDAEKAAEAFSKGDFADARKEATEAKEKNADDEALVADADYIIAKVDAKIAALWAAVETAKEAKRWHEVERGLEALSDKPFKGLEAYDKAKEALKELKKDKDIKKEIKAWEALEKLLASHKDDDERLRKALIKFAEKNEGLAAADEAKSMVQGE